MPNDGWFRKKSKFSSSLESNSGDVPDGVATKCPKCSQVLFKHELDRTLKVCPHCGHHFRLTAAERIEQIVDQDTFVAMHEQLRSNDPIHFPDYLSKLEKYVGSTGLNDGMVVGVGRIDGIEVSLGVADFFFKAASMGSVAGEKVVRAMETGIEKHIPVVLFTASGGARMEEGLVSLMQMAKTSAAAARVASARIPFIVVMTDATMAGVLAAYASLGDIILAEPGATIGFAGARVSAQASIQKPPADYQTAEWQLAHGHIDQVVHRKDLPGTLSNLIKLLGWEAPSTHADFEPAETISANLEVGAQ